MTAIIDWYSRYLVGWALSDSLDTAPVLDALKAAIERYGYPAIINSDQGSQFTSREYTEYLEQSNIRQSMDGKARWVDNVLIERWFRSLKCECIYINEFNSPRELRCGISAYVNEYNNERPHSEHAGDYPAEVYLRTEPNHRNVIARMVQPCGSVVTGGLNHSIRECKIVCANVVKPCM